MTKTLKFLTKMYVLMLEHWCEISFQIKLLMKVHHRNLTSLIGFCNEETNKGLIYEYMANGNLQEYLSGLLLKIHFQTVVVF